MTVDGLDLSERTYYQRARAGADKWTMLRQADDEIAKRDRYWQAQIEALRAADHQRGPVENIEAQHEFEITFTLAAGYDEDDATELLDYIEAREAVSGAAMSASHPRGAVSNDERFVERLTDAINERAGDGHTAAVAIWHVREALKAVAPNTPAPWGAVSTCPVCQGRGTVSQGFYLTQTGQILSSGTGVETCRSCEGAGYVTPSTRRAVEELAEVERLREALRQVQRDPAYAVDIATEALDA